MLKSMAQDGCPPVSADDRKTRRIYEATDCGQHQRARDLPPEQSDLGLGPAARPRGRYILCRNHALRHKRTRLGAAIGPVAILFAALC